MTALRAAKNWLRNREFTTAEASAMLGLSGVQVNNLIDELAQLGIAHSGDRKRAIEHRGLFSLKLCRDLILWDVGPALDSRSSEPRWTRRARSSSASLGRTFPRYR